VRACAYIILHIFVYLEVVLGHKAKYSCGSGACKKACSRPSMKAAAGSPKQHGSRKTKAEASASYRQMLSIPFVEGVLPGNIIPQQPAQ